MFLNLDVVFHVKESIKHGIQKVYFYSFVKLELINCQQKKRNIFIDQQKLKSEIIQILQELLMTEEVIDGKIK